MHLSLSLSAQQNPGLQAPGPQLYPVVVVAGRLGAGVGGLKTIEVVVEVVGSVVVLVELDEPVLDVVTVGGVLEVVAPDGEAEVD